MKTTKDLLFHNIDDESCRKIISCMHARTRTFDPGEIMYSFTDSRDKIGLVESGEAMLERMDINGSRTLLERLAPGDVFGAVIAFGNERTDYFHVICSHKAQVLFMPYSKMLSPCSKVCSCHRQLIYNLFQIYADKVYTFGERIEVLSNRSIRGKFLYYLDLQASKHHSKSFLLPYTMTGLADYLCVDRSALSREVTHMQQDGLFIMKGRKIILP